MTPRKSTKTEYNILEMPPHKMAVVYIRTPRIRYFLRSCCHSMSQFTH
ncbi:hypothetical protein ACFLVM_03165 [Chloroflexota bacterium]